MQAPGGGCARSLVVGGIPVTTARMSTRNPSRAKASPAANEAAPQSKSDLTREHLIAAAIKVVGRVGYHKASSARIAEEAGVSTGLMFYHFGSRQALLDELLPALGVQMVAYVTRQIQHLPWGLEHEVAGFRAILTYLDSTPEFFWVLSEARVYSPLGYARNFEATLRDYERALEIQRRKGFLNVSEKDVPLAAHFLTGIRNYVSHMYLDARPPKAIPIEEAVALYRQLISKGLFSV